MADPGDQELQQMIERVIKVVFVWMPVTRLKMREPVERTPQPARHMNTLSFVDAEAPQRPRNDPHDPLHRLLQFNIARAGMSVGCGIQARMSPHDLPPGPPDCYDGLGARHTDGCLGQRTGEFLATSQSQLFHEVVIPFDMAIQRWLTNTEFVSNASECDRVEALAVCQRRGALDHLRLVQSPPGQSAHPLEAITKTLEGAQRGGLD